eukprot:SAG31_NODE_791_length_12069_cov_22.664411_8_plen_93_part_00
MSYPSALFNLILPLSYPSALFNLMSYPSALFNLISFITAKPAGPEPTGAQTIKIYRPLAAVTGAVTGAAEAAEEVSEKVAWYGWGGFAIGGM